VRFDEGISGEIINIGTGEEVTMKSLLQELIELMGLANEMAIDFQPDRPADVPRLWVNPAKFIDLTQFKASVTFEEGLKETIAYYRELMADQNLIEEVKVRNWEVQ
jgi:UDP-glucose 4-epimerase